MKESDKEFKLLSGYYLTKEDLEWIKRGRIIDEEDEDVK